MPSKTNPKEVLAGSVRHATSDLRAFLQRWGQEGRPPVMAVEGKPVDGLFWLTRRVAAAGLVRRQAFQAGVPDAALKPLDQELLRGKRALADIEHASQLLRRG